MKQTAITYGSENNLIGIYSEPDHVTQTPNCAFLVWNTGVSTRTGHFRGHIEICRVVTGTGFPILRFDLSGRGDSNNRSEILTEQERNTKDITDSMNYLKKRWSINKFILIGICSGAVDLHYVANIDSRVIGFVMVDTYCYRNKRFYLHYFLNRMKIARIMAAVVRNAKELVSKNKKVTRDSFIIFPSIPEIKNAWQKFMSRNLKALVIFTAGVEYVYSYKNQFYDLLHGVNFAGKLNYQYLPTADHVFIIIDERRHFHNILRKWIETEFGDLILQNLKTAEILPSEDINIGLENAKMLLGRDQEFNPAWFMPDMKRAGKWLKVEFKQRPNTPGVSTSSHADPQPFKNSYLALDNTRVDRWLEQNQLVPSEGFASEIH